MMTMKSDTNRGFITLMGLLIAAAILGYWFYKFYNKTNSTYDARPLDTYMQGIEDAKSAKNILETRPYDR